MKKIGLFIAIALIIAFSACKNSKKETVNSDNIIVSTVTNDKGETLKTTFNTDEETATILFQGDSATLQQQPSASGIVYSNNLYEYTEWQGEIELTKDGVVIFSYKSPEKSDSMSQTLTDPDGNLLVVQYDTSNETPAAIISYKDFKDQVLTQNYAWANGGEYQNETLKWETTNDGGDLTINEAVIHFKNQNESSRQSN